jgi:hypothetical protein
MITKHIFDCELGDLIRIRKGDAGHFYRIDRDKGQIFEAEIIYSAGIGRRTVCIGWDEEVGFGWLTKEKVYLEIGYNTKYGWWITENHLVEVFEKIFNADQKCIECNRPAPHGKPNLNDKYICSSCSFIKSIGE